MTSILRVLLRLCLLLVVVLQLGSEDEEGGCDEREGAPQVQTPPGFVIGLATPWPLRLCLVLCGLHEHLAVPRGLAL